MTKLGTPIGAGPKSAIVSPGLASVGVPSGRRLVDRSSGEASSEEGSSPSPSPCPCPSSSPGLSGLWPPPRPSEPRGPETPASGWKVSPPGISGIVGSPGSAGGAGGAGGSAGSAGGGADSDSLVSSGLVHSGSPRSTSWSASSSTRFEHSGSDSRSSSCSPSGRSISTAPSPLPTTSSCPTAVPATTHAAKAARQIVSESLLLIRSCPWPAHERTQTPACARGEAPPPERGESYLFDRPFAI